jgi:hypothetical protein
MSKQYYIKVKIGEINGKPLLGESSVYTTEEAEQYFIKVLEILQNNDKKSKIEVEKQ